ncbi:MAG: phospholipase D-like domain-containing protein [Verrucomicrobiota bacterium]
MYSKYIDAIIPLLPIIGATIGFALAFILISRLMREKQRPSNTFAWLLIIILAPYVGVPLYIVFGGRKLARLKEDKSPLRLLPPESDESVRFDTPFGIITEGNRTKFLHDGIDAFDTLVEEIRTAEKQICITTFILSHDAVGRRIVKELAEKAKQGIEVRLLVDGLGSFGKKTFYILLTKAGGKIERFMPVLPISSLGRANLRNHRKVAIFDNYRAIIGGRNIGREYMGPNALSKRWKDFGVLIEGPAIMPLASIFEADWTFAGTKKGYKPKPIPRIENIDAPDKKVIEIMASGPDTQGDPIYEKILSVIQEAEEEIIIATPYFLPDEVLLRSLMVKARTGKQVTIIVPKRSNHRITDLARSHYIRELLEAGARNSTRSGSASASQSSIGSAPSATSTRARTTSAGGPTTASSTRWAARVISTSGSSP